MLKEMSTSELLASLSEIQKELRIRKVIRSKNIVGDLGEYLAIQHYNKTAGLPNLVDAPVGTQNVDALSRAGDRYSIKSTTRSTTGVFYGLPNPDSTEAPDKKFEFVLIVKLDDTYSLLRIYQLKWDQFLEMKRWNSRMQAWNLPITKKLEKCSTIVYDISSL